MKKGNGYNVVLSTLTLTSLSEQKNVVTINITSLSEYALIHLTSSPSHFPLWFFSSGKNPLSLAFILPLFP
ncbi:hypothetical protein RJT34_02794 [Clitoria ternatea]|uniref:Uncharacterized protein n=1 Tax=Clitoria ternatea TaxID=43366 RepID=A0AAN9Q0L5_CLITE